MAEVQSNYGTGSIYLDVLWAAAKNREGQLHPSHEKAGSASQLGYVLGAAINDVVNTTAAVSLFAAAPFYSTHEVKLL